jgi:hypothetical protein
VEYVVSIWNRIGDVASTFTKASGRAVDSVVGGVFGIGKMAYDIGTAPWNDDEDYNGFLKPFKSA